MSDDGLFIPQSSITIQNVVGEGKKQHLAIIYLHIIIHSSNKGEFGIVYKALLHDWNCDLVAVKTLKGIANNNNYA